MTSIQEYMASAPGVINAEFHEPPFEGSSAEVPYVPIPQTPSDAEYDCSVTVNFPEMLMLPLTADLPSVLDTVCPPGYTDSPSKNDVVVPVDEWALLPAKL
jgi:hypothetical protein